MAIKKTINGVAPIMTTQIKAPNLKKAVVGIKKDELTIKPQEEVIEEVESVTEIPTPLITDIVVQEPISALRPIEIPSVENVDFEKETKLAKEKRFGRFFICLGIILLVLMILNKK